MNKKEKFASFIVKFCWLFFSIFIALFAISALLIPKVQVNYDMTKYLPQDSEVKIALNLMEEEFGSSGTASVMLTNATLSQISSLQAEISNVPNVATVVFDSESASYYDGTHALLQVFFKTGNYALETATAIDEINTICKDYETAFSGQAVESTISRTSFQTEIIIIMLIAVAIVLLILTLTARSWLEPLIYLCVIGVAILINMGTNVFLGEISFITQSISTVMLIALEMDYCIVLCSRFREEESKGKSPLQAITSALAGSFTAIIASSCTVMAGLVALMFMNYTIGFDIGIVLAKGVFISILAVIFFMPSIILLFSKAMHKTAHRSFIPQGKFIATLAEKTKRAIPIAFALVIVASAVLQMNVSFSYSVDPAKAGSKLANDRAQIEECFGHQNSLVVMVPNNKIDAEIKLYNDIVSITVGGEKLVNSSNSIVSTPLYSSYTVSEVATNYNIDKNIIIQVFNELGKKENDTAYMIELIDFFHQNNTLISSIAEQKQANIDALYSGFNVQNIYAELTYLQAQNIYQLSNDTIMKDIYSTILGFSIDLAPQTALPNYIIMEVLYSQNIEGWEARLSPIFASEYQPFAKLTALQVQAMYGLPESVINEIFATYQIDVGSDTIRVLQLVQALNARIDETTIIENIANQVQNTIENGYIQSTTARQMFASEKYHRMIFNINANVSDDNAKMFIEKLNDTLKASSFTSYYVANETANVIETSSVFSTDRLKVDLITIVLILLIVLLAFRSFSVPVLLVLTIQGAIWINLAISCVMNEEVYFVCYLLAMAIQMGATIDYGILLTDRYIFFRRKNDKKTSLQNAIKLSLPTILSSGLILILAALTIHFVSTTPIISEIGLLIGRGALISVLAILFILPQLLMLFDKLIEKTTKNVEFLKTPTKNEAQKEN